MRGRDTSGLNVCEAVSGLYGLPSICTWADNASTCTRAGVHNRSVHSIYRARDAQPDRRRCVRSTRRGINAPRKGTWTEYLYGRMS
jgi:hypothetical protein